MNISIVDSFVKKVLKNPKTTGAGEGKLHIGSRNQRAEFNSFFNNFININCKFNKDNLIEYIHSVLDSYKDIIDTKVAFNAFEAHFQNILEEINAHNDFDIIIEPFIDPSRFYIRPVETDHNSKKIWNTFFRNIALPLKSELEIVKNGSDFEFLLHLFATGTAGHYPQVDLSMMNRILYSAPGTGKSYILQSDASTYFSPSNIERINFYNGYTYGQFVGTYKPKPVYKDAMHGFQYDNTGYSRIPTSEPFITYEYVAGIFLDILLKAIKNSEESFCLIIEEINRTKVDAVFGDMFQLLDRDETGKSEYRVKCSTEMLAYIQNSNLDPSDIDEIVSNGIYLPENLYLWATMNSADQGVFPMDTAFKRRWNFEYIGLDKGESLMVNYKVDVSLAAGVIEWNHFRKKINKILADDYKIAEDKLIAPFFVKPKDFDDTTRVLNKNVLINKVIMYLKEDVLRHRVEDKIFIETRFSVIAEDYENSRPIFKSIF
jgi:MoxR-like ATPase